MVRGMEAVREFRQHQQRLLQLQLAADDPAGLPASVRSRRTNRCARSSCAAISRVHQLAANLRRAFSGIVTGNVKEYGIQAIEQVRPVRAVRRPSDHEAAR